MKLEVRNTTTSTISRGGFHIPPNGLWHEIEVPEYRVKEVTRATYLETREPGTGKDKEEVIVDEEVTTDLPEFEEPNSEEEFAPPEVEEDDVEELDLDELDYSEIQAMAKSYGIKANQSRDALVEQILAADEEE